MMASVPLTVAIAGAQAGLRVSAVQSELRLQRWAHASAAV